MFGPESEETSTSGVDRESLIGFLDRLPRGEVLAMMLEPRSKDEEEEGRKFQKSKEDKDEGPSKTF